jgi:hypothetical protein
MLSLKWSNGAGERVGMVSCSRGVGQYRRTHHRVWRMIGIHHLFQIHSNIISFNFTVECCKSDTISSRQVPAAKTAPPLACSEERGRNPSYNLVTALFVQEKHTFKAEHLRKSTEQQSDDQTWPSAAVPLNPIVSQASASPTILCRQRLSLLRFMTKRVIRASSGQSAQVFIPRDICP